jgi:CO/xanthine dehydrogenase Mo-binding subunit
LRRIEGGAKVRGDVVYAADLHVPHLTHARLVLSPHAAARIGEIDTAAARRLPGVLAVVAGDDLAGQVRVPGLFLLASDAVVFSGQPVVVVVAETEAIAADAAALVDVDYEPLPAVVDPLAALDPAAPAVLPESGSRPDPTRPNVTDRSVMELGDADAALDRCAVVVEGRFELPPVHQAPMEPHVAVGLFQPDAGFTVHTPTQSLFITQQLCAAALGVPMGRVRVVPTVVGGGFGGKLGVLLEPLVAWLARRCARPVRLVLTRTEEFGCSGRATGCVVDLRLGASSGGRFEALAARVVVDNGAGPGYPASRVGAFLTRPYRIPAFRVDCVGVITNTPPANAYRGQPAALACFALESAVDQLAQRLGQGVIDLRLRNLRGEGDPDPVGGVWPRVGLAECLEAARPFLGGASGSPDEGVGLALGVWDGYPGAASAGCRLNPDGSITVQVGTVDISGTHTTLAMIAAEAFGIGLDRVSVELGDSASAPHSLGAGGSAVTYVLGHAVAEAAAEACRQLREVAAEALEAAVEDVEIAGGEARVRGVPNRSLSVDALAASVYGFHSHHAPVHGHGRARLSAPSPMAAVHVVRVRVDRATGGWALAGYAAIQDVGRAINPAEIVAQVHGGAMQGVGRALGEELAHTPDGTATASFATYELPTIDTAPAFQVELVEVASELGPMGARGAGEPPILPGPPAIANAIAAATGVRLRRVPFTAQDLHRGTG